MVDDPHRLDRLGKRLEEVLASGLAEEPATHARQVAEVAGILHSALTARGLTPTLVGGSAIEIHAPGIYMSGDLDLVIEGVRDVVAVRDEVFHALGLTRVGRHWKRGDLFVETVPGPVAGPAEEVEIAGATFSLTSSDVPVTHERLLALVDQLNQRKSTS